jgi:hypothetical protein
VRPLADLLVVHPPKSSPILDVAHIPDRNGLDIVRLAELHNLAAGFMQEIALLSVQPGTRPTFALHELALAL